MNISITIHLDAGELSLEAIDTTFEGLREVLELLYPMRTITVPPVEETGDTSDSAPSDEEAKPEAPEVEDLAPGEEIVTTRSSYRDWALSMRPHRGVQTPLEDMLLTLRLATSIGNKPAARHLGINPSSIIKWRPIVANVDPRRILEVECPICTQPVFAVVQPDDTERFREARRRTALEAHCARRHPGQRIDTPPPRPRECLQPWQVDPRDLRAAAAFGAPLADFD